jgi:hypothetical protein
MKVCTKCGKEKELYEFYKDGRREGRLRSICKLCMGSAGAEHRKKNPEYYSTYSRAWRTENKDLMDSYIKRYVEKYPRRRKARGVIGDAIRCGKLIRPEVCSSCGASGLTEAHHEDYSKPLEVVWLCKQCHAQVHRKWY